MSVRGFEPTRGAAAEPEVAAREPGRPLLAPSFTEARDRHAQVDRRYRRITLGLILGDIVAAELGVLLGLLVVAGGRWTTTRSWALLALGPLVLVAVFASNGLYRVRRLVPAKEFRKLFGSVSVSVILLGIASSLVVGQIQDRGYRPPLTVGWIGVTWLFLLVLVMGERKIWHGVVHGLRRSGALAERTLILGANDEALELVRRLAAPGLGFRVVGLVSTSFEPTRGGGDGPAVLGTVLDLPRVIEEHRISCVFVASSAIGPIEMAGALQTARRMAVEVRVSANLPDMLLSRLSMQTIGGKLAFSLERSSLSGGQATVKRAFDLMAATLSVAATSPIWLAAAVLVKATSRGPVLFRQERVGRHGRPFTIYKFRTMVEGAESRLGEFESLAEGRTPLFKLEDDPRLTRVGRFLRRWSIDELPQLLNVVRGDMSLVGPRPMPATFDRSYYQDWHLDRLEVLPGITGLWQVSGRSNLTFDECVQLDTFYIENWSVAYDLYILLKTIPAVFRRRGAM